MQQGSLLAFTQRAPIIITYQVLLLKRIFSERKAGFPAFIANDRKSKAGCH